MSIRVNIKGKQGKRQANWVGNGIVVCRDAPLGRLGAA